MRDLRSVIFDFDGVLADTSSPERGLKRIAEIAALHGYTFDDEQKRFALKRWGQNGPGFIQECLRVDAATAKTIYESWEEADARDGVPLVEGAEETVLWCWEQGIIPCMLTSRYRKSLEPVLVKHGLDDAFVYITAHEDTKYHKPHGRAFDRILNGLQREYDIPWTQCVFVGDTYFDIQAGHAAHVMTLVVETGPYNHGHREIAPLPEDHVLPSVAHLPAWYENSTF